MNSKYKIYVVGLGYIGLPLARLFSIKYQTVGFDMNQNRVDELNRGYHTLKEYANDITIDDPSVDISSVNHEYQINIINHLPEKVFDAIILAVSHSEFLTLNVRELLKDNGVIYNVKGVLNRGIIDGRL